MNRQPRRSPTKEIVNKGEGLMAEQPSKRVTVGMWVKLTGFAPGEEEVFHLVPHAEANVLEKRIPPSSPLAQALEGAAVGDTVPLRTPAGEVELTILEAGAC
jgi:transcription elongation GreA/GreB family factor